MTLITALGFAFAFTAALVEVAAFDLRWWGVEWSDVEARGDVRVRHGLCCDVCGGGGF